LYLGDKENKATVVVATPGHGPDRPQEVSYTDTKIIGKDFSSFFIQNTCAIHNIL